MQYHFLLLLASVAMATPLALPSNTRNGSGLTKTIPGRVLTKTYTYDSTKDLDDPCNPITGDPERCLRSMEDLAPRPNAPNPERFYVAEELGVAQKETFFKCSWAIGGTMSRHTFIMYFLAYIG
ncbi:hypothetical protein EV426DRAFT_607113 [Tirmania nivea]|nr:hypothetical protein EV426DRAFT_607113 [Tirmania nivea]